MQCADAIDMPEKLLQRKLVCSSILKYFAKATNAPTNGEKLIGAVLMQPAAAFSYILLSKLVSTYRGSDWPNGH